MTEDEAVAALQALPTYDSMDDYEKSHAQADKIIASFAPERVRKAYSNVGKWYA